MPRCLQMVAHFEHDNCCRFSSNSEAKTSELLENLEEMYTCVHYQLTAMTNGETFLQYF